MSLPSWYDASGRPDRDERRAREREQRRAATLAARVAARVDTETTLAALTSRGD